MRRGAGAHGPQGVVGPATGALVDDVGVTRPAPRQQLVAMAAPNFLCRILSHGSLSVAPREAPG